MEENQHDVRGRVDTAKARIQHYQRILTRLQDVVCKHPEVQKTPRADTGNYDPSSDRYWYECRCKSCDKFWTEPQ